MTRRARIRLTVALVGIILAGATFLWLLSSPRFQTERGNDTAVRSSPPALPDTASISPAEDTAAFPEPHPPDTLPDTAFAGLPEPPRPDTVMLPEPLDPGPGGVAGAEPVPGELIIPVAGIDARELLDTYSDARSEGRTHNAIDIIAPLGSPVLAAADGQIVKLFNSEQGGITLYQLDARRNIIYYYAHLDRYADDMVEGKVVRQGDVIAYVGDTGNAAPGNYHLHFSISLVTDPKRYWEGVNVNPYPILKGEGR